LSGSTIFDQAWQLRCEAFAKVSDHVAAFLHDANAEGKVVAQPKKIRMPRGGSFKKPAPSRTVQSGTNYAFASRWRAIAALSSTP
jgi:hypothetical protein